MIDLPAELIELILTIKPNKIVSTIKEIRDNLSTQYQHQETRSIQTRSMTNSISSKIKRIKLEIDYSTIFWNCYKKSTWLKYFLNTSSSSHSGLLEYVDNVITELMVFYKALSISTQGGITIARNEIENFENTVIKNFNDSKYRQMLDCIISNYSRHIDTIKDIPLFIRFWTLLYQCGYLDASIHEIFLSSISFKRQNKDNNQELTYYQVRFGLLPVINIYCGMGFTYVIAWDFHIDSLIGFLEGGSSGLEAEGNYMNMMKYVNLANGKRKQRTNKAKLDDYLAILNKVINKKCEITQLFNLSVN